MKTFAYIILSIVVVSVLASSPVMAAEPKKAEKAEKSEKAEAATAETKITKKDAQQLFMQKYPGATVISCEMDTVKGNSVWVVRFTRTGGNLAEKVMVDAQTGKITRL